MKRSTAITTAKVLSLSLALSLGLGGCWGHNKNAGDEDAGQTQAEAPADSRRAIGDTVEAAYAISLVNGCATPIETLALRPVGTLDYAGDILAGVPIGIDEEVILRVSQEGASPAYDLRATTAGGTVTYEFVGVPVASITQVFLHIADDGMPYVDYVSPDGVVSSTKDYLVAQAPVALREPAATTLGTATVARPALQAAGDPVPSDGTDNQDIPMKAPAADAQSVDACIDDVMLK